MLLYQLRKVSKSTLAFLLFFIRFCSSPTLHQSLWNMRHSKRQQVRRSTVCFISSLVSNVAGRKRARVLAVLRWSEGEKAWLRQEFLQDLDPAEEYGKVAPAPGQLCVLLPVANCSIGDGVNIWRIWRAVVHNCCTLQRGYLYHKHGVCNISLFSVLSLAQDKWAAGVCSKVSAAISILKIPLYVMQAVSRRESGQVFFSLRINTFP